MNDPERREETPENATQENVQGQSAGGPNLALLYSLVALALVAAVAIAAMIVMPFYRRR
jgi:hypothetical protein